MRCPQHAGPVKDEPGILIRRQAPLAMDAVRALGIRVWPMVRFQADDALATGARVLGEDADVEPGSCSARATRICSSAFEGSAWSC